MGRFWRLTEVGLENCRNRLRGSYRTCELW